MRSSISTNTRYLLIFLCLCSIGFSRNNKPSHLAKPSTREFIQFTGNNINSWMGNYGHLSSHVPTGDAGTEWPDGSDITAIFSAGIWFVGQVDSEHRSVAAEYTSEWSPGIIPYDTQTQLPTSDTPLNTPDHQVYFIREGDSSDPASANYNREYATWPASQGAPSHDGEIFSDLNRNGVRDLGEAYEDFNLDGSYNPPDGQYITGDDPPKMEGQEQAWWVMNGWHAESHDYLWRTDPLGLEAQVLIHNRSAENLYENVQLHTFTLVNKGGVSIDSCYFSYWSDPDIGDAVDDAAGCDPELSLGYAYNHRSSDQSYGLRPPAVGNTFLQGPIVSSPGDTIWQEEVPTPDMASLGMTAYVFFAGADNRFGDPENVWETYFLMQGLNSEGQVYEDPWGTETVFLQSGDPVAHTGWTGIDHRYAGDKRFLMSTGPFHMEPWDDTNDNGIAEFGEPGVQVIHGALIITDGADHLDAITNLKYVTRYLQNDFDNGFESLSMEPPALSASSHDQEIILNWYEGADEYEALSIGSYEFEGYNLYQGLTTNGPWTKLVTFDLDNNVGIIRDEIMDAHGLIQSGVVQLGDDTGLEHIYSIQEDVFNEGEPLVNNKQYHFALSAYAYDEDALPKTLESEKLIISIRPHWNSSMSAPRDTLAIAQIGVSEVNITVDVLDPSQTTGEEYEIGFEYDSTDSRGYWHLIRGGGSSRDTLLRSDWFNPNRYEGVERHYIDGFELSLDDVSFQAPRYRTSWEQTRNIRGDSSWVESYLAVSPGGVDSLFISDGDTISLAEYFFPLLYWHFPEYGIREEGLNTWFDLPREETHSVRIQAFASHFGALGGDRLADVPGVGGGSEDIDFLQSDLELRFTEAGQTATMWTRGGTTLPSFNGALVQIPFEVWDIERNIQQCVAIIDYNETGGIQDTSLDDWGHSLDLDWVVVFDNDYDLYGTEMDSILNNPKSGWCWQFNTTSKFSVGDVVTMRFLNAVIPGYDVYSWSTEVEGIAFDEDALEGIQIFPNPYFGYQSEQSSFSEPFVTLSNLPEECIIRIYSLGGQLVRRFDHELGTYEYWDLLNQFGATVASGIYVVHIEVPELGNKILKIAVFQPQ